MLALAVVRLERLLCVTCKEVAYYRLNVEYCDGVERCFSTSWITSSSIRTLRTVVHVTRQSANTSKFAIAWNDLVVNGDDDELNDEWKFRTNRMYCRKNYERNRCIYMHSFVIWMISLTSRFVYVKNETRIQSIYLQSFLRTRFTWTIGNRHPTCTFKTQH